MMSHFDPTVFCRSIEKYRVKNFTKSIHEKFQDTEYQRRSPDFIIDGEKPAGC